MSLKVSVVVPVYRSDIVLPELVQRIGRALPDQAHEIILVDDGSPTDTTWPAIDELATRNPCVRGLRLSRNFGQHNALLAGVRAAQAPVIVTLDDDLQNPPEEVPILLRRLAMGDADVVYGASPHVAQNLWRRWASSVTRRAMASALGAENAAQITSFRAFRTSLREAFTGEIGPSVSLDALLSWGTSRFASVEVEHHDRREGRSNYTFRRLVRHALDVSTGYSSVPLQIATGLGLVTAIFGLGVLVWVLGRTLLTDAAAPGFPFLASTIAIFAGAQLLTLGIMGEYLARMHFRIMRKPTYVIGQATGAGAHPPGDQPSDRPHTPAPAGAAGELPATPSTQTSGDTTP
jgi:glycosyltransferase involved in cell wall biosynthesis